MSKKRELFEELKLDPTLSKEDVLMYVKTFMPSVSEEDKQLLYTRIEEAYAEEQESGASQEQAELSHQSDEPNEPENQGSENPSAKAEPEISAATEAEPKPSLETVKNSGASVFKTYKEQFAVRDKNNLWDKVSMILSGLLIVVMIISAVNVRVYGKTELGNAFKTGFWCNWIIFILALGLTVLALSQRLSLKGRKQSLTWVASLSAGIVSMWTALNFITPLGLYIKASKYGIFDTSLLSESQVRTYSKFAVQLSSKVALIYLSILLCALALAATALLVFKKWNLEVVSVADDALKLKPASPAATVEKPDEGRETVKKPDTDEQSGTDENLDQATAETSETTEEPDHQSAE